MSKVKTANNTLYLPKEKIWVNPKCFELITVEDLYKEIPFAVLDDLKVDIKSPYGALFKKDVRKITKISKQIPVKNTPWDYIRMKDMNIFRPAAVAFEKSQKNNAGTSIKPTYTNHFPGTIQHKKFWKEELRRIRYGYEPAVDGEPCGIRISGEFYFYLNYSIIQKLVKKPDGTQLDVKAFPDFLLMDYFYFRELDARERPHLYDLPREYKKVGITVAKARRKGYSYKAAAGSVWVTAFPKEKNSSPKVLIASDTGSDAALCFKKAMLGIDWLTEHTPFGRKNPGSVKDNGGWKHITSSVTDDSGRFTFGLENTRTKERKGRLSEIATVSLAQRADKAAGEGVQRVYFEESGKVTDLEKVWEFTRPTLKVGTDMRGVAIIFGTGGEMVKKDGAKGHSMGFSKLFNAPVGAELADFDNIHEYEHNDKKCGWFICDMWFDQGGWIQIGEKVYPSIDDNGNPNFWVAELSLNQQRFLKSQDADKDKYNLFLTQHCKTPKEAFLVPQGSVFPTADLAARDTAISMSRLGYEGLRSKGTLVEVNGEIIFEVDLANKLNPIDTYVVESLDREGCLLKYESPLKINGVVPEGAYIISVDPIGQNTVGGKSLSSIIVMKTPKYRHIMGPEKIVATYRGRSTNNPQKYVQQLLLKLSKYYNAKITYENDRDGGILAFFLHEGELGRLMSKPKLTLEKYLPNSRTALREYGHSMATIRHKQIGEDLLLAWLLKRQPAVTAVRGGEEIVETPEMRNLDLLEDRAIIEELIAYNRTGNFDTVMALMGAIIQINEHFNEDYMEVIIEDGRQSMSDQIASLYYKSTTATDRSRKEYEYNKNLERNKGINVSW